MYKLVVLDIDGTLLTSKKQLTKKTLETLNQVRDKGVVITLCTGRNLSNTLPIANLAKISQPFICMDGAMLYDPQKKVSLFDAALTSVEVSAVLEAVWDEDILIELSDGLKYYKYAKSDHLYQYDFYHQHTGFHKMKRYFTGVRYMSNADQFKQLPPPYYQLALLGEKHTLDTLQQRLASLPFPLLALKGDLWENCLFVGRKGIQKSSGVKLLCTHFGIEERDVVAFGDDKNDIDMLQAAGMGIAMDNASEEIKQCANYITASNDADGVAKGLAHFFL